MGMINASTLVEITKAALSGYHPNIPSMGQPWVLVFHLLLEDPVLELPKIAKIV